MFSIDMKFSSRSRLVKTPGVTNDCYIIFFFFIKVYVESCF